MKNDHLADYVRQRQAYGIQSPPHSIRQWFKVALAALAGLMLFTSTSTLGQQAYALEFCPPTAYPSQQLFFTNLLAGETHAD
jgi:hypothetical protein